MEIKKSIKKGKSKKDYQKSLLKKIAEQAKKKNACSEQLMPFLNAIDNGDYLIAWQTVLSNLFWLSNEKIKVPNNIETLAHGIAIDWKDGKVIRRYHVKNKKINGLYYEYFSQSGKILMQSRYKDDKLHGWQREWYANGSPHKFCYYQNNVLCRVIMWDIKGKKINK